MSKHKICIRKNDYYKNLVDIQQARKQLPKVGTRMRRTPTAPSTNYTMPARWCEVIRVYPAHLWYQVRFSGINITECYRWPE